MSVLGVVDAVEVESWGSFTVGATLTGATVLPIDHAADFSETGGLCNVGGAVIDGAIVGGVQLAYTAATTDDDNGDTLTLTVALLADVPDRTTVLVDPLVQTKTAVVVIDSQPYYADVPPGPGLWDDTRLAEGADGGQIVEIKPHLEQWQVCDIPSSAPQRDTAAWDRASHPPAEPLRDAFQTQPDTMIGTARPDMLAQGILSPSVEIGGLNHDDQGHRALGPDGTPVADFPNDGRPPRFTGALADLSMLATNGGAQIGGGLNIPPGSYGKLSSTLTPPPINPGGTMAWTTKDMAFTMPPQNRIGLGIKDLTEAYSFTFDHTGTPRLVTFSFGTGVQASREPFVGAPEAVPKDLDYSSLTDEIVRLDWDPAAMSWSVNRFDTSGVFTTGAVVTQLESVEDPRPAVSAHEALGHEYLIVARANPDGTVDMHQYVDGVFNTTITTVESYATETTGFNIRFTQLGGTGILTFDQNPVYPDGVPIGDPIYPNRPVVIVVNIDAAIFGANGIHLGYGVCGNRDEASYVATLPGDTLFRTFLLSAVRDQFVQHSNWFEAGAYWTGLAWYRSSDGKMSQMGPVSRLIKIPGSILTISCAPPPPGSTVDGDAAYMAKEVTLGVYPGDAAMVLQHVSLPGSYSIPIATIATTGDPPLGPGDPLLLTDGGPPAEWVSDDGSTIVDSTYSNASSLPDRLDTVEAALSGLGALGVDDDLFFAANGDIIATARA